MKLLTCLTALSLLASGCASSDDEPGDPTEPADPTDPTDGNETVNKPPTASLAVLFNGTALEPLNGTYNTTAGDNLTFDGSASSDPDGDNLSFSWDLGDGNTSSEAMVVHNYSTPGVVNVTLVVADPDGLTAQASVVLNVSAGAALILFYDGGEEPQAWTFSTTEANSGQSHPLAAGWHTTDAQALVGTHSWTFADEGAGGYHDAENSIMTSADIDLSGVSGATWSFWYMGQSEAGSGEDFSWQVSADGGAWDKIQGTDAAATEWTLIEVDLSKYVGSMIRLRYQFVSDALCSVDSGLPAGCGDGDFSGYYVDDILVTPA